MQKCIDVHGIPGNRRQARLKGLVDLADVSRKEALNGRSYVVSNFAEVLKTELEVVVIILKSLLLQVKQMLQNEVVTTYLSFCRNGNQV